MVRLDASALGTGAVSSVHEFIRSGAVPGEIKLEGVDAERIASLWRQLPPGEPARCHIPPYGLRFWQAGKKVIEASLCWECNNAYGYSGRQTLWFTFDAKAPVSVALLMQLRHVLPTPKSAVDL